MIACPRGRVLLVLIVLIGIVGMLALVLYPAGQTAREITYLTSCKSSLSQLSMAMITYASQNQNYFPHVTAEQQPPADGDAASRALGLLYTQEYVTSVKNFQCRNRSGDVTLIRPYDPATGKGGITGRLGTSYGYDATHMVNDPADVAILADSFAPRGEQNHGDEDDPKWLVAYTDGHVETRLSVNAGALLPDGKTQDHIFRDNGFPLEEGRRSPRESYIMGGIEGVGEKLWPPSARSRAPGVIASSGLFLVMLLGSIYVWRRRARPDRDAGVPSA